MDHAVLMSQLEVAAQALQGLNSSERSAAERLFLSFRKTRHPYPLCRYILENCRSPSVIFETGKTLQFSIIREWNTLEPTFIGELQNYLVHYLVNYAERLEGFARKQIITTLAVLLKRGFLEENLVNLRAEFFKNTKELLANDNILLKEIGISVINSVIAEFAGPTCTPVGFTWEFHDKCKRKFEQEDMKNIFELLIPCLNNCMVNNITSGRFLMLVVSSLETILTWRFSPNFRGKIYVGSFRENPDDIWLRPGKQWRGTLIHPDVGALIFNAKMKVQDENLHTMLRTCISQLCAITGDIFENSQTRLIYVRHITGLVLQFMSSFNEQQLDPGNVWCVSTSINHIISTFSEFGRKRDFEGSVYLLLSAEFEQLMVELNRFMALCIDVSCQDMANPDNIWLMESYDLLLDAWVTMLSDCTFPKGGAQVFVYQLFQKFITVKLEMVSQEDEDEYHDEQEDDLTAYEQQLIGIACIARNDPANSLNLLLHLFKKFSDDLNVAQGQEVIHVMERLHWLILISGHVIADSGKGETSVVAESLNKYSSDCHKNNSSDSLVGLINSILRLLQYESGLLKNNQKYNFSPLVAASLMWFTDRFAHTYLHPPASIPSKDYGAEPTPLSQSLASNFHYGSEGGRSTLLFLIESLILNLLHWPEEEEICKEAGKAIHTICSMKHVSEIIYQSDMFNTLYNLVLNFSNNSVPGSSLHLIAKACMCLISKDPQKAVSGTQRIVDPVCKAFSEIVHSPNFNKTSAQDISFSTRITKFTEIFRGFIASITEHNWQYIFQVFQTMKDDFLNLVHIYKNCPEICIYILELIVDYVEYVITYVEASNLPVISDLCLTLLQIYAHDHKPGSTRSKDNDADFSSANISLFIKLLTHIISKDFLDFGDAEIQIIPDETTSIHISNVVLQGIQFILPLMTTDLFQQLDVCVKYYELLSFMCCNYSDKVSQLDQNLMDAVMIHIKNGLTDYGEKVGMVCFEAIGSLATNGAMQMIKIGKQEMAEQQYTVNQNMTNILTRFLEILFNLLLLEDFDMNLIDVASESFWPLILFNQPRYSQLVQELTAKISETEAEENAAARNANNPHYRSQHQRLQSAFYNLMHGNDLSNQFLNTSTISRKCLGVLALRCFRKNLQEFLMDVRGFLRRN